MHPPVAPTGQGAAERETAVSGSLGSAGSAGSAGPAASASPGSGEPGSGSTGSTAAGGVTDRVRSAVEAGPRAVSIPEAAPGPAVQQLGVLIGGGPGPAEAVGRPEERAPVRVAARPLRIGRGTSLVVLPSWRPAIAVSVPTDRLLTATGLGFEQLAGARLTVLMNPAALHDRELDLHGWECVPAVRGRRGGRP